MERQWKLGNDVAAYDNLLDAITFDELILTLHCNLPKDKITPMNVRKQLAEIIQSRMEDMNFLIENNMSEIIEAARR